MKTKLLMALALLVVSSSYASAQFPNGFGTPGYGSMYKPPVSPYLNLLRNGNSPAFNYTTLVAPQLKAQSNFQMLQGQVNTVGQTLTTLEQQAQAGAAPLLPVTGQSVGFMTQKAYFMNISGASFASSSIGSGTAATPKSNVAGSGKR